MWHYSWCELHVFQIGDVTVLFPAASIFVNLMNAYDKPEIMPEMKQLAEYAKQKVPEEHPKVINGHISLALIVYCKQESCCI